MKGLTRQASRVVLALITAVLIVALILPQTTFAATASSDNSTSSTTQSAPSGTPPEKPSGDSGSNGGTPPTPPDGNSGNAPGGAPGGGSTKVNHGSAKTTIKKNKTVSNKTYTSTSADENALRVSSGAKVTLNNVTINKKSGKTSDASNGDFYGINAGFLAMNKANVTINNATVKTNAQGGNGIFSYGKGTKVTIKNTKITTKKDNSGGIQTTGGATTIAKNLTVNTAGNSAAAIRSDRGGGTVKVTDGTYTSTGYNSPGIYSTAKISAKNAKITAKNSEALVIEGKNSITLKNSKVSGNMSDTKGTSSDENVHNVMIYQSMSGDAATGTAKFNMTGGSLTSNNGDVFYVTNTKAKINLTNVKITNKDKDSNLFTITGNSASRGWGTAGQNGANVTLTASKQKLKGNIVVDTISTLDFTLKNKSTFTGTITISDNAQNGTAVDNNAVVTIEKGSTWNLTGDATVSSLTCKGKINFNGHKITLSDGTVITSASQLKNK